MADDTAATEFELAGCMASAEDSNYPIGNEVSK